jgi:arylsulfatase A-like enzyme
LNGLFIAACLVIGCSAPAPKVRPNFILIVVDTLRFDRLHFAGYPRRENSPTFDALRAESAWFEGARATASWTLPSLTSLFVSQIASQHRVVAWGARLPAEALTLTEVLREAGYRTGGWSANILIKEDLGLPQGFDEYKVVYNFEAWQQEWPDELVPTANAVWVGKAALDWIGRVRASGDAPFFAYLHYMEPHTPYRCREGAPSACVQRSRELNERLVARNWDFSREDQTQIQKFYDVEINKLDVELNKLFEALKQEEYWENTWVILTADHGESLGENGTWLHGRSLEPQEVRVPLLISSPKRTASVIHGPVSLIDIAPTLLDIAGIEAPASFSGRSLKPALEGEPLSDVPVIAELFEGGNEPPRHRLAVIRGSVKIIEDMDGSLHRFDLRRDPRQRNPLAADSDHLSRLSGDWAPVIARARETPTEAPPLSPETREQLRALGYAP